uniref:Uncharacterized protein n=1 Tax=Cannabis sativa TaxID=3483 RepID=A0A803R9U5_CANSA
MFTGLSLNLGIWICGLCSTSGFEFLILGLFTSLTFVLHLGFSFSCCICILFVIYFDLGSCIEFLFLKSFGFVLGY